MAVPLEKFSEMLEESGQKKSGGSSDVFNKDKSCKLYTKFVLEFSQNSHWIISIFYFRSSSTTEVGGVES